jgi:hypothetical protein
MPASHQQKNSKRAADNHNNIWRWAQPMFPVTSAIPVSQYRSVHGSDA